MVHSDSPPAPIHITIKTASAGFAIQLSLISAPSTRQPTIQHSVKARKNAIGSIHGPLADSTDTTAAVGNQAASSTLREPRTPASATMTEKPSRNTVETSA